ncbi:MAG: hypothetical protein M1820_010332 [Bogoriella megaspora]|nr:MAG: hypothetical protein M1820_010332 [Bogoriella megaspora]
MDPKSSERGLDDLPIRQTGSESSKTGARKGNSGENEDCPVCHQLDLPIQKGDVFHEPSKLIETNVIEWSKVARLDKCWICPVVWKALETFPPPEGWPPQKDKIRVRYRHPAQNCMTFSFLRHDIETREDLDGRYTMTRKAVADEEHTIELYKDMPKAHIGFKDKKAQIWRSIDRDASSDETIELIWNWLGRCFHYHDFCDKETEKTLPDRVLYVADGQTDHIYLRDGLGRKGYYVTLSYCWGPGPTGVQTTKGNILDHKDQGILIDELPPTLRDAVRLAQKLSVQYLWIDRLCIVQDDHKDWAVQAGKMCDIYANALLCISADNAQNVWAGLFQPKSYAEELERDLLTFNGWTFGPVRKHTAALSSEQGKFFPTLRRAWILQEHEVSRRLLRFTPNELIWHCNSLMQCECRRESSKSSKTLLRRAEDILPEFVYDIWRRIVREYSTRSLTYQEDRFPALSGLASGFARVLANKGHAQDEYLAGLWKNDFAYQLCWLPAIKAEIDAWQRNNTYADPMPSVPQDTKELFNMLDAESRRPANWNKRRPDTYVAPTWSWASISGPLAYFQCHPRSPFLSQIELLTVQVNPLESSNIYGKLKTDSNAITVQGHVSSNLRLKIFRATFSPKDQDHDSGKSMMQTIFLLNDGHGTCIEIEPDDPIEVAKARSNYTQALKCLLVGSIHCPRKGQIVVQPFDGPDKLTRVNTNNAQREYNSPGSSEVPEIEPALSSIFNLRDENANISSFYLLLAPVPNLPGSFERIACFHAGFDLNRVAVMKNLFMQSRRETVTIL